jgi:membrane associated rhomboid family serine protease
MAVAASAATLFALHQGASATESHDMNPDNVCTANDVRSTSSYLDRIFDRFSFSNLNYKPRASLLHSASGSDYDNQHAYFGEHDVEQLASLASSLHSYSDSLSTAASVGQVALSSSLTSLSVRLHASALVVGSALVLSGSAVIDSVSDTISRMQLSMCKVMTDQTRVQDHSFEKSSVGQLQIGQSPTVTFNISNDNKFPAFLSGRIDVFGMPIPRLLFAIVCTNISVFLAWQVPNHRVVNFLSNHFQCSVYNLKSGRIHTLLTNAFSHSTPAHMLFNTLALVSIADMWAKFRPTDFVLCYAGAAIVSTLAHFAGQRLLIGITTSLLRRFLNFQTYSRILAQQHAIYAAPVLGASGVVYAFFTMTVAVNPHSSFYFFFIPYPISGDNLLPMMMLFDTAGALAIFVGYVSPLAHLAHIAGAVFGFIFFQTHYPELRHRFKLFVPSRRRD